MGSADDFRSGLRHTFKIMNFGCGDQFLVL